MQATLHAHIPLLHSARVVSQTSYGEGYYVVELECPELAQHIGVGQFVNVRVRGEMSPLLRRPFSVFDVLSDAKGQPRGITLLYHIVGQGTRLMSQWQLSTVVSLNGPLGQVFHEPADANTPVIMVGGGIGLAPFLLQAQRWLAQQPKRPMTLLAGGRRDKDLKYMPLFSAAVRQGLAITIATEDGSAGIKGRVTLPLEGELRGAAKGKHKPVVYCCGPTPMMKAVAEMCACFEVPCVVSLESVMACGYGVCNGCVTATHDQSADSGIKYKKTCVVGPAFDARDICWEMM